MDLEQYVDKQMRWSKRTFGDGKRTIGISKHIRKELEEIAADPDDLMEWIDICILALDGFWRAGGTPRMFVDLLEQKQAINMTRQWPPPQAEDQATEHIRG